MATRAQHVPDLKSYLARWKALDTYIDALAKSYEPQEFPRKDTVLHLLRSLQAFAASQFKFFYYGFYRSDQKYSRHYPALEINDQFPAEDVLTAVIEQIGHDLELIQRAADQRLSGNDVICQTLANADKLAWAAVKPAIDYAVVEEATTVLTYFEKSAVFYRIPYAQVALIAIPFTCMSAENHLDYLAIPHEVGHYVYRHATSDARKRRDKLLAQLSTEHKDWAEYEDWVKGIFEETFADIYGCLIGGPVMALDLQELSLATNLDRFVNGDGEHPNPILRPYIYAHVLRNESVRKITTSDWQPIGELLAQQWDTTLKRRGGKSKFAIRRTEGQAGGLQTIRTKHHDIRVALGDSHSPGGMRKKGPLSDVIDKITNDIIERILQYLDFHQLADQSGDLAGWGGEMTARTKVHQLYSRYEKNFDSLMAEVKLLPPEADPSSICVPARDSYVPSQLWVDWVDTKLKDGWPLKGPMDSGEVKDPDKMKEGDGTWGGILYADGWTTGGRGPDPGHPWI